MTVNVKLTYLDLLTGSGHRITDEQVTGPSFTGGNGALQLKRHDAKRRPI